MRFLCIDAHILSVPRVFVKENCLVVVQNIDNWVNAAGKFDALFQEAHAFWVYSVGSLLQHHGFIIVVGLKSFSEHPRAGDVQHVVPVVGLSYLIGQLVNGDIEDMVALNCTKEC